VHNMRWCGGTWAADMTIAHSDRARCCCVVGCSPPGFAKGVGRVGAGARYLRASGASGVGRRHVGTSRIDKAEQPTQRCPILRITVHRLRLALRLSHTTWSHLALFPDLSRSRPSTQASNTRSDQLRHRVPCGANRAAGCHL